MGSGLQPVNRRLRRPRQARGLRNPRLVLALSAVVLAIAVIVAQSQGGGGVRVPLPGIGKPARAGDPFGYIASRESAFVGRATSGSAQVLFTKSPGGVMATAARVAGYRPLIDAATRGSGIDPNLLEGIVFVESAGRPDVVAGSDAADAAGLTQILAETGQSLLAMHIDLAQSRKLPAGNRQRRLAERGLAPAASPGEGRRPLQPAQGARRDGSLPANRPASLWAGRPGDRLLPHGHRKPLERPQRL